MYKREVCNVAIVGCALARHVSKELRRNYPSAISIVRDTVSLMECVSKLASMGWLDGDTAGDKKKNHLRKELCGVIKP